MLRRLNTMTVLSIARADAPRALRIGELMERSGLARPTVRQVVEGLVADGWLVEQPPDATGPAMGRPAARYALRGDAAYVLGIDIGPHRVAAAVTDIAGVRRSLVRRAVTGSGRLAARVRDAVDGAIDEALAEASVLDSQIRSVLAATPGIVDEEAGPRLAPSIPGWASMRLVARLDRRFGCPVRLENDANAAAVAISAARGAISGAVLVVQWGERLGSGIVIDGRLFRGASAAAGEIGFISVSDTPNRTDAVGRGPLEHAIGSEAISRLARAASEQRPGTHLATAVAGADETGILSALFTAASQGDDDADRIVDEVGSTFARAIAPIVLALDPAAVVIGGGIARAGSVLADTVSRHLAELTLTRPVVELSPLAEDAIITGAVRIALDDLWRREAPAV